MHNNQTTVEEHTVLAHPNKADAVHGKSASRMTVKQTNQAFEELRKRSKQTNQAFEELNSLFIK